MIELFITNFACNVTNYSKMKFIPHFFRHCKICTCENIYHSTCNANRPTLCYVKYYGRFDGNGNMTLLPILWHSKLMSQSNTVPFQLHSNLVKALICWYDLFISIPTLLGSNQLLTLLLTIMVASWKKKKKETSDKNETLVKIYYWNNHLYDIHTLFYHINQCTFTESCRTWSHHHSLTDMQRDDGTHHTSCSMD